MGGQETPQTKLIGKAGQLPEEDRAGVAWWVTCLSCDHKDQSWVVQHPYEKLRMVLCTWNPRAWWVEAVRPLELPDKLI